MKIPIVNTKGELIGYDTVPDQGADEPTVEERMAALETEVRGMRERAAVEAAKTLPDAKAVAQAVAGP